MRQDIRDQVYNDDENGMRIYVQSKIREDGATGAVFRFALPSFEEAVKHIKHVIPSLRSYSDAIAIIVHESDYRVDDNYPVYDEISDYKRRIVVLKRTIDY